MILRWEGLAYHSMRQYEEAIAAFKRARARDSQEPMTVAWLALTYADMDRMEQARAAAQEVLEMNPGYSAKGFVKAALDHEDRTKPKRALATLRQLGLPE
jgi:tetratricopeptide (TPR) repeat protein